MNVLTSAKPALGLSAYYRGLHLSAALAPRNFGHLSAWGRQARIHAYAP